MPVYEFLCESCNRVFSFLARTPEAERRGPKCPRCGGRRMRRLLSVFAAPRRAVRAAQQPESADPSERNQGNDLSPDQEARMERAMAELERDIESVDESNPRQMAALMRKLSDVSGESLGPEMEEAIRRLEAGEEPEKVEEAMADAFGEEGPEGGGDGGPSYDDGLYDL